MASLHQYRCFLAAFEHGSLTAAAAELGYAQPSVSEQIRGLEKSLGIALFERVGRGVVPTAAAEHLRPYAERTLDSAAAAEDAVRDVRSLERGTIRFGLFGAARLYLTAGLIRDVLERHPGVRVELISQNSSEVEDQLRRGRIEAAVITTPLVADGLTVVPIARDELVYVSADPERLKRPVRPKDVATAPLVLPDTSFREQDSTRARLRLLLHEAGYRGHTRVEVEDAETALEVAGTGVADTVMGLTVVRQLLPALAPGAGWVSLRPKTYEGFAVAHRTSARLSPAARLMIDLATKRMREVAEPVYGDDR